MSKSSSRNLNLCIITFPLQNYVPLVRLARTLEPLASRITLITGSFPRDSVADNVAVISIKHDQKQQTMLIRIPKYVIAQLKIMYQLIKARNEINIVIFFVGGSALLLPMLAAKLLHKKIILSMAGSATQSIQIENNMLYIPIKFMAKLNFALSDRIILYGKNLIEDYGLGKYRNKISIAHGHYIDFDEFKIQSQPSERDNVIGYIGRLSPEKGTLNFVEAIPKILQLESSVRFLIAGDGQLWDEIGLILDKQNLRSRVSLINWVPHKEIPKHLNELKLLVLPSYTEGLPNIVLEAMACGTPVLVTAVGCIPDIIRDNETGFILTDNSPKTIATSIVKILSYNNLDETAKNARAFVESNFDYQTAVEGYRNVLARLL